MAQFETIVRPVVFPDIRPAPARTLPPEDNPEGGAVIRGNPAKIISLSYSYSFSASSSNTNESKRRVDEVRVYQQEDDGTINRDNFVDIKVANKIWVEGAHQPSADSEAPKVEDEESKAKTAKRKWTEKFKRVEETRNIEIRKKDQMIENPKKDE